MERKKAGGCYKLLAAQEYEAQLSKIVKASSEMPSKMKNDHYKYMVKEE